MWYENMKQQEQTGITVFSSYAYTDKEWQDKLAVSLSQLKRDGLIEKWFDQQIRAGADRPQEIKQALLSAHIILLLISADFLASDAQYQIEMQQALERHKKGVACVIPIIVRPCEWEQSPFAHLQCLPHNTKPITTWDNQDEALLEIAKALRKIIVQQQFPSAQLSHMSQNDRKILLERVHKTWIDDFLNKSFDQATWIDLHLQDQPDALENPWHLTYQEMRQTPQPLPTDTSIIQIYDEANGELLILGEPGAGKTTLLLHLAQILLDRAKADEQVPVPVVFHLSFWAPLRQPLDEWLMTELHTKYRIPQLVARQYIETNLILPLLDGLDEVSPEDRVACIQAIITYHNNHLSQASIPLVICCRNKEYQELPLRLPLQGAVNILPLTKEQIDEYLSKSQGQLEGLRQAIHTDAGLTELARQPLILRIFALAYQGVTSREVPTGETREKALQTIFTQYIQLMLDRREPLKKWKKEQMIHFLTFLARQMRMRNITVFYIEALQPDWLSARTRHLYRRSTMLLVLLVCMPLVMKVALLQGWLVFALSGGLIGGLYAAREAEKFAKIAPAQTLPLLWESIGRRMGGISALTGMMGGALTGMLIGALGGADGTWIAKTVHGPFYPMLYSLFGEAMNRATSGMLTGGLIGEISGGLFSTLFLGLVAERVSGIGGWPSNEPPTEALFLSPNEAVWHSVKVGLRHAVIDALSYGLILALVIIQLTHRPIDLPIWLLINLLIGLHFGLQTLIHHFILRFWLWRTHRLPWQLVPFLDEATKRLLLRKVGGSYIFVHRLLLEYFADLGDSIYTKNTYTQKKR